MHPRFLLAVGLLAGTIIGAGIFSLPYVFDRLGILTGVAFLIVFTLVYFAIHVMYAELTLTRDGEHQFVYFAKQYLSKPLAGAASCIILGELIFVLTVYLILAPSFAELVVPGSATAALVLFWALGSIFIFAKLDVVGWTEFLGVIGVGVIAAIILVAGGGHGIGTPLARPFNIMTFFLPFGPLLFSLSGRPAVPEVVAEYRRARAGGNPFSLVRAILWGTAIPAAIYLIFIIAVLRLSPIVTPEALTGLTALPAWLLGLIGIMGIVTLWTSYFVIGLNVRDILRLDLKTPPFLAALIAIAAPLLLYLIGFRQFLEAVSFTGGIFLALEGIFVIVMWRRAFPENRFRRWAPALSLVFLAALVYETIHFLGA